MISGIDYRPGIVQSFRLITLLPRSKQIWGQVVEAWNRGNGRARVFGLHHGRKEMCLIDPHDCPQMSKSPLDPHFLIGTNNPGGAGYMQRP